MCKHVAAVMYGIGSRLDTLPELLFTLRGVDATELISADINLPASDAAAGKTIADDQLSDIFGIEMDEGVASDTLPTKERIKMTSRRSLRKKTSLKPTTTPTTPKADVKRVATKKNSRRQNPKLVSSRASKTVKKTTPPIDLEHPTALAIFTLQTELGLSVAEFAVRLGISPETVYNWQKTKGKLNLQRRSLEALAKLQSERS